MISYECNEILLRRLNKIYIPKNSYNLPALNKEKAMIMAFIKNIEAYGFSFDKEIISNLMTLSKNEIEDCYFTTIDLIKHITGADKQYFPMYPNFPKQVADASDAELFFNAIFHYWTLGTWMPEYKKNYRMPLFDTVNTTVLHLGSMEDLTNIFKNLLSSKTNLSDLDKQDIQTIKRFCHIWNILPEDIPLKENLAFISRLAVEDDVVNAVSKYYKTATDVLRFIAALSDSDISLHDPIKVKSLSRKNRRMIMDLLAGCGDNLLEDMYRYQYQWIRVGEMLHPSEECYNKVQYCKVREAFDTLRNDKKPLFIAGKIQNAIKSENTKHAADLLVNRPGDFARQLDKLLRDTTSPNYIINSFRSVADKVSVPVLLQARWHFANRNKYDIRVAFPKGNVAKAISFPVSKYLSDDICNKVVDVCDKAILRQFKDKDPMGKVYVDESLKNYLVPFSQRSANSGTKMLVRGSHIPLKENATTARAFIWWTNQGCSRVDLDLSATIYDENWNYIDHISFTNPRSSKYKAYHSGDITNGGSENGKGVAEFIDIDINSIVNNGSRYVAFQVYSFTQQYFNYLKNCRFGWMEREDVNSGEIFEPSTVDMSIDINSNSMVLIPVIFDCVTKEFIWCDMVAEASTRRANMLENALKGVTAACYAITNFSKPNIYDLVMRNVEARGTLVTDRNEADIIFSNDTTPPVENTSEGSRIKTEVPIITAYNLDYFMGQML